MPVWFVGAAIVAGVGALLAQSGDLVLISTLYSFGVMIPIWYLAANLWWMLIVALPLVLLAQRGRWLVGAAGSLAVFLGLVALVQAHVARQEAALPALVRQPVQKAAGQPASVELVYTPSETPMRDCDSLCERLLTGPDIQWVRVVRGDDRLVYFRAPPAQCDGAEPCLLPRADTGDAADLRVDWPMEGNGFDPVVPPTGSLKVTVLAALTLTDRRGAAPVVLGRQALLQWQTPTLGLLSPGMTALGSGRKSDGLSLPSKTESAGEIDPARFLQEAGLTLGPERDVVPQNLNLGYPAPRPADAALVAALVDMTPSVATPPRVQMVADWLAPLAFGGASPNAADLPLLRRIAEMPDWQPIFMGRLLFDHADWFIGDMRALYDEVITGDEAHSQLAASKILTVVRSKPLGSFAADGDAFLAAWGSGRQDGWLVQIAASYAFDPTPILQQAVARHPGENPWMVLSAACRSDPKWAGTLGPFLRDQMLPLLDHPWDRLDALNKGTASLVNLGRLDLVQDLMDRVDWDAALAYGARYVHPSPDLARAKQIIFGPLTRPARCY